MPYDRLLTSNGARLAQRSAAAVVLLSLALCTPACTPQGDPALGERFTDTFDRAALGDAWNNTGGPYRLQNGELRVQGARNKPLWLRRTLPHDIRIEFDVRSESPEGDIKVEVFGDGTSKATTTSYTATSYVLILGGWHNRLNVLARMNEHGDDRVEGIVMAVQPGKRYHMKIERQGAKIGAWVDGEALYSLTDPEPLYGPGHDHFAFNNWETEVYFDNLTIEAL